MAKSMVEPMPDLKLADGSTALCTRQRSNQGTVEYTVYFPRSAKKPALPPMNEAEFEAWRRTFCA